MSGHRYLTNNKNLFEEEEEIDDETFLKNSNRKATENYEQYQQKTFLDKKREIEERTLFSTEKSLGLLKESEKIGIATGEELLKQREQLEKTDRQLDDINERLKFSQKHINGIKSVFGNLKNYISGSKKQQQEENSTSTTRTGTSMGITTTMNKFSTTKNEEEKFENHPSFLLRKQEERAGPTGSRDFSTRLNENLLEMQNNISQIKFLANDLSMEIDSQNDLLERITDKTEIADLTINKQNKDMNKLLKK